MNGPSPKELRDLADRIEQGSLSDTDTKALLTRWHARICTCAESCCPKHNVHADPHVGCMLR